MTITRYEKHFCRRAAIRGAGREAEAAQQHQEVEGQRRQYETALVELGRTSLRQALVAVRSAGKTDPWRWLRGQIRDGRIRWWGTIEVVLAPGVIEPRRDQPLDPAWLDHEAPAFGDMASEAMWFERDGDANRPGAVGEIAVDAAALAAALKLSPRPADQVAQSPTNSKPRKTRISYEGDLGTYIAQHRHRERLLAMTEKAFEQNFRRWYAKQGEPSGPLPKSRALRVQIRKALQELQNTLAFGNDAQEQ